MKWIGKKQSKSERSSVKKPINETILPSDILSIEKEIEHAALTLGETGYFYSIPNSNNLWISKSLCEIFEIPVSESIPLSKVENLLSGEDKAKFNDIFKFTAQNTIKSNTFNIKIISGSEIKETKTLHIKTSKLSANQANIIFGWVQNISAYEKQVKDILREKQKAEEADQLKTTFLANISHEIRTPMNSILGFSELLNINSFSPDKQENFVHIIKSEAKNLLNLIDDIAEYTKLEYGQIEISKTPCNLNLILNELNLYFSQQKSKTDKEGIDLELVLPDGNGISTYTDSGRLQQILINILTSILQNNDKGTIQIGYEITEENKVQFFIRESGNMLSKDDKAIDYKPFSKIEETLKNKDKTDLGLVITKSIVRLLGGKIWITTEEEKGSTIFFTIPLESVPEIDINTILEKETSVSDYNWRDKVVLVVEDEDVNARFLEALIEETQAQVLIAGGGQQAIELVKSISKIDMILMDIRMPEMNGYEATRRIREFNPTIPIIAQTAFALGNETEKCMQVGCNDLVIKPIEVEELLTKMNRLFTEHT